jgi:hypothetical protein
MTQYPQSSQTPWVKFNIHASAAALSDLAAVPILATGGLVWDGIGPAAFNTQTGWGAAMSLE